MEDGEAEGAGIPLSEILGISCAYAVIAGHRLQNVEKPGEGIEADPCHRILED